MGSAAPLGAVGWRRRREDPALFCLWACTVGMRLHVLSVTRTGLPWTCPPPPDPARPTGTAFISHPWFLHGARELQNATIFAMMRVARLVGKGCLGLGGGAGGGLAACPVGGSSNPAARGDAVGVGAGAASLEEHWPVSPPLSPPRLGKQDLSAGACGAGLSV